MERDKGEVKVRVWRHVASRYVQKDIGMQRERCRLIGWKYTQRERYTHREREIYTHREREKYTHKERNVDIGMYTQIQIK